MMAMDLLRQIASSRLPRDFASPDDIDKVCVLHAAGLVVATIPEELPASTAFPAQAARVIRITAKGREELRRNGEPDDPLQGAASTGDLIARLRALVERARSSRRD